MRHHQTGLDFASPPCPSIAVGIWTSIADWHRLFAHQTWDLMVRPDRSAKTQEDNSGMAHDALYRERMTPPPTANA
jgi:hypothetical protein